jgi:hypothetical protein
MMMMPMAREVFQAKALESWAEVCFPQDENLLEGFLRGMSAVSVSLGLREVDMINPTQSHVLFLVTGLYMEREA